ncbi:MAG: SMC-Scp complex subunit ScpB [Candidatus Vogelbacteria bacterium]|nr:SMC-Scp complex subunit ScpB [Candidatus Vogelbacteria bacterium]
MQLDKLIESVLFWKGEPISKKRLEEILIEKEATINSALDILEKRLIASSGLVLLRNQDEVSLGTSPDASKMIETLTKDELEKDLGKASLETLTIVLYRGPISRSKIDNIRGVNSSFILRNLQIRGLIERQKDPKDERAFLYMPTTQLITYLGIGKIEDLPEYEPKNRLIEAGLEAVEKQAEKET